MNEEKELVKYRDVYQFLWEHKETVKDIMNKEHNNVNIKFIMTNKLHDINDSMKFIGDIIKDLKGKTYGNE